MNKSEEGFFSGTAGRCGRGAQTGLLSRRRRKRFTSLRRGASRESRWPSRSPGLSLPAPGLPVGCSHLSPSFSCCSFGCGFRLVFLLVLQASLLALLPLSCSLALAIAPTFDFLVLFLLITLRRAGSGKQA
jgi:hypothetical protein